MCFYFYSLVENNIYDNGALALAKYISVTKTLTEMRLEDSFYTRRFPCLKQAGHITMKLTETCSHCMFPWNHPVSTGFFSLFFIVDQAVGY